MRKAGLTTRLAAPLLVRRLPAAAADTVLLTFDDGPTPDVTGGRARAARPARGAGGVLRRRGARGGGARPGPRLPRRRARPGQPLARPRHVPAARAGRLPAGLGPLQRGDPRRGRLRTALVPRARRSYPPGEPAGPAPPRPAPPALVGGSPGLALPHVVGGPRRPPGGSWTRSAAAISCCCTIMTRSSSTCSTNCCPG